MSSNAKYTQEQLDIALLRNTNEGILLCLQNIDKRIDRLDDKIDSHFKWTMGTMLSLNAIVITSLLAVIGHTFGWF